LDAGQTFAVVSIWYALAAPVYLRQTPFWARSAPSLRKRALQLLLGYVLCCCRIAPLRQSTGRTFG